MKKRALALIGFLLGAGSAGAAPRAAKKKQVLFFTKSSGYEHAVIRTTDGQPSLAQKILEELGNKNGFAVTHTKDGGVFTPENIAKYDAFVFFTTGDLTTPGLDKNPPLPAGAKELLLDAISKGKGFVGVHSASDTFLTPGDRFADNGDATDPFLKMLGGEFIGHGQQQKARVFCADPKFPGFADAADGFEMTEEWYSFKNMAKDLHVLLWLATWSVPNTGKESVYRRGPYPIAWTRMHGRGRVFHTGLGHRDDVWSLPMFQSMLVGGIKWASGATPAVTKPNAATVTPYYAELPPDDVKAKPATPKAVVPPRGPGPDARPRLTR